MTKITQLPQDSSPSSDDITITVDTTSGQAKKVTLADLATLIGNTLSTTYATNRTTIFSETAGGSQSISTTFTDMTNWTGGSITTTGGDVIFFVEFTYYKVTGGVQISAFRLVIDGSTYAPNSTGFLQYTNENSSHKMISRTLLVTGLSAGVHTVKLQGMSVTSGTTNIDSNDYLRVTAVEYLH